MNQRELFKVLAPLSPEERLAFLMDKGTGKAEAQDYLAYLFPVRQAPKEDPREKTPGRLQEAMAKLQILAKKAKENPVEPKDQGLTLFERDILHNRYLLGGETLLDGASYHNPKADKTEAMNWLPNTFLPSGKHFAVMLGQPGSGKTFAALAYANRIAKVEIEVFKIQYSSAMYVHAYKMAEYIHNSRKYGDELNKLASCGVLVVDDLGCEPVGYRGKDFDAHFGYLIGERHKFRKKTIITSNASFEGPDGFKELYDKRIISRLSEVGLLLQTKQEDMRRAG